MNHQTCKNKINIKMIKDKNITFVVEYQFLKEILVDFVMIVYRLEVTLVVETVHQQVPVAIVVVAGYLLVEA
jgi:hypothetical protein